MSDRPSGIKIIIASLAALLVLWSLGYFRLALTSDAAIAARITRQLNGVTGLPAVTATLAKRYKVRATGKGKAWVVDLETLTQHSPTPNSGSFVTVLVGEYRAPFVTSVEAAIQLDPAGHVQHVSVRRSVDAL